MIDLYLEKIETPIGSLIAIASNENLLILQTEQQLLNNKSFFNIEFKNKSCDIIKNLRDELRLYFNGSLKDFKTPLDPRGTDFQHKVWNELRNIPYGEVRNYSDIALKIGIPTAQRAIANANARNKILILIPCHRVIRKSGDLCGYNAGVEKKKWLLDLEKIYYNKIL